jgi:hypothetical protein
MVALNGLLALSTRSALADDSPAGAVKLGPDIGVAYRPASSNDTGVKYHAGLAYGVHAQIPLLPWLRASTFVLWSHVGADYPAGSIAPAAVVTANGDRRTYVIGGRLQPTLHPLPRLSIWANAGGGWGVVKSPSMHVAAATSFDVSSRDGVFVELGFGVGGEVELMPRRLAFGVDAVIGPVMSQSGDIYDPAQVIDASGHLAIAGGLPRVAWASSTVATVTYFF